MNLKEYLDSKKISIRLFSRIMGISYTHMYGIATGFRKPGRWLCQEIIKKTSGQVSMQDLKPELDEEEEGIQGLDSLL